MTLSRVSAAVARIHAQLAVQAMSTGKQRSAYDLMIAATAAATNRILLTTDGKAEFKPRFGLAVPVPAASAHRKRRGSMFVIEFRRACRSAILAAVDGKQLADGERLIRIRGLLQGVPGPLGNGEMLTWVNPGEVQSMPHDVLTLIKGAADHLERWTPGGSANDIPRDAADLMSKLTEVAEAKGAETLVWLLSSTMAYRMGGRYTEGKARNVAGELARLLGYGARWWTNTDLDGYPSVWPYNPVTQHTMSAVVVGVGNGVVVTILAVDED